MPSGSPTARVACESPLSWNASSKKRRSSVSATDATTQMRVAVVQRHALAHALGRAAAPQERPVDAAAVDDVPARALALESEMGPHG